jgi:hypothetical protein
MSLTFSADLAIPLLMPGSWAQASNEKLFPCYRVYTIIISSISSYEFFIAFKITEQAWSISSWVMVNGGAILKLCGCDKNQ